jgi:hypothetical protein
MNRILPGKKEAEPMYKIVIEQDPHTAFNLAQHLRNAADNIENDITSVTHATFAWSLVPIQSKKKTEMK